MRLLHPRSAHWQVEVQTCSARDKVGIEEAWETILRHHEALETSNRLAQRRAEQARDWMWAEVQESLIADLKQDPAVRRQLPELEAATSAGKMPAATAAHRLLETYLERHREQRPTRPRRQP